MGGSTKVRVSTKRWAFGEDVRGDRPKTEKEITTSLVVGVQGLEHAPQSKLNVER